MTRQFSIDHKLIQAFNKKPIVPKQTIKKVYATIPDDKKIPIQFMSKHQYLKKYIKNQESKHNIDFPKKQEQQYIKKESIGMNNIVSRYTTKHNPYYPPAVVFFNDKKINKQQFNINAMHEFGHELWEKNKQIRHKWNFPKAKSPTLYGTTNKQEDFADSFSIFKNKSLPLVSNPKCSSKDLKNRFDIITRLPTRDISSKDITVPLKDAKFLTLYHGTRKETLPSIQKEGLLGKRALIKKRWNNMSSEEKKDIGSYKNYLNEWKDNSGGLTTGISLTPSKSVAYQYALKGPEELYDPIHETENINRYPTVIKVTLPKKSIFDLYSGIFHESGAPVYEVAYRQKIPPKKIKIENINKFKRKVVKEEIKFKDDPDYNTENQLTPYEYRIPKEAVEEDTTSKDMAWDIKEAKDKGWYIRYMKPKTYLKKTGLDPENLPKFIQTYHDYNQRKKQPIEQLSQKIASKEKVDIPWLSDEPELHEGRHRAYAAMLAEKKKIPVATLYPKSYSNDEIFEEFYKKRNLPNTPEHRKEWKEYFDSKQPIVFMNSEEKQTYDKILHEKRLLKENESIIPKEDEQNQKEIKSFLKHLEKLDKDKQSQNAQLYLAKPKKQSFLQKIVHPMLQPNQYSMAVSHKEPTIIYISEGLKNIEQNNDHMKLLGNIISHEEIHHTLKDIANEETSEKLDNITSPIYTQSGKIKNPTDAATIIRDTTQWGRDTKSKNYSLTTGLSQIPLKVKLPKV